MRRFYSLMMQICAQFWGFWIKTSGSIISILETSCRSNLYRWKNFFLVQEMRLSFLEIHSWRNYHCSVWPISAFQLRCASSFSQESNSSLLQSKRRKSLSRNIGTQRHLKSPVLSYQANVLCWTIFSSAIRSIMILLTSLSRKIKSKLISWMW